MAINEPLLLPGGAMLLNSGKMVEDPADCCCTEPGDDCEYCEGVTPKYMELVLSDQTLCDGCYDAGGGYFIGWGLQPAALPATMLLTQDGSDPCLWTGQVDIAEGDGWPHIDTYTDEDCTAHYSGPMHAYNIRARLKATAVGLELEVYYTFSISTLTDLRTCYIFVGSEATATPCGGVSVIQPDYASCGANFLDFVWATGWSGGTVTVEAT